MTDLDKMPDMLACPFCGSDKGQVLKFKSSAREGYRARCTGCGITQGHPKVYGSTRRAIETWNNRVASASEAGFLNGILQALGVLNSAGDFGGSSYNQLVCSCGKDGKEKLIHQATEEGILEWTGLSRLVSEFGGDDD